MLIYIFGKENDRNENNSHSDMGAWFACIDFSQLRKHNCFLYVSEE